MPDLVTINLTPLALAGDVVLPAIIDGAGDQARVRFVEFFTANIRNKNTRLAYARAVGQFLSWCEAHGLALDQIQPVVVAAYIEQHPASVATVKQHLAAIRMLFDWLVVGQVVPVNPASSVRGPKHVVENGKTPVLDADQARALLDAIDTETISGLRDRAIIGVMLYTFARVSAVVRLTVEDYYPASKRWKLRLHEKGGKVRDLPVHHQAEEYLDAYLNAAGIRDDRKGPLFRTVNVRRELTANPMHRNNVTEMAKRRARQAGLPADKLCSHTFRGTGITTFLSNGGQIEMAQAIAGHASPRTTKLYDRRQQQVELAEIERIRI